MLLNLRFNVLKTKKLILIIGFLLFANYTSLTAQFIKTNGTKLENADGKEVFLTGINLGNWLLWEGYLMMGEFKYKTHTQFFNNVKDAFGGDLDKAIEFEHQWRLNYVTETTITDLKDLGINSVRVPFHYNLFWDYNSNSVSDRGFEYIDNLIEYCSAHDVYILLDMHAAPGYQNPGDHCDNLNSNDSHPRESVGFWDGNHVETAAKVWKHIATRYKDEPVIWGYDLINEPVPQDGREYELLPSLIQLRNAIREVDNNHIIVAEGSWWGSDMEKINWRNPEVQSKTGINSKWDDNLVYQTHHYSTDVSLLNSRLQICNDLNVPLMLGEYGESDLGNIKNMTDWCLNNNVSYFPWSFKKVTLDKCLWTIEANDPFKALRSFIKNGGNPPANIYSDMIDFCNNNIANGAPSLIFHDDFYQAIKNTTVSNCDLNKAQAVPAQIEAENYCDMFGVQTENTSDNGGGLNIGYVDKGDWLNYSISTEAEIEFAFDFRVASVGNETKEILVFSNDVLLKTISFSESGGWQNWETVSTKITLPKGNQLLRIEFNSGGINLNWFKIDVTNDCQKTLVESYIKINNGSSQQTNSFTVNTGDDISFDPQASSNGSWSWSGPNGFSSDVRNPEITNIQKSHEGIYTLDFTNDCGKTTTVEFEVSVQTNIPFSLKIEAEDYADMSGIAVENTNDYGGGQNIGWTDDNDWIKYNVNIPENGTYTIEYRVASPYDNGVISLNEFERTNSYGEISIPNTGGWQNWTSVSHEVILDKGSQEIFVFIKTGGFNLNWIGISNNLNANVATDVYNLKRSVAKRSMISKPNSNTLNILGANDDAQYSIYSISGSLIKSGIDNTIHLNNLPKGIYIIEIESEGIKTIHKFLKN